MREVILAAVAVLMACGGTPYKPPSMSCEDTPTHWLGGYEMGLSNRAQGLWTNPNVQTDAPDGANDKAENIELDRSGLARPRVGQRRLVDQYANPDERFRAGTTYQGYGFEFASALPGGPGTLYRRDPGTEALTSVLSMSPPTGVMRPRLVETSMALFVATSTGVLSTDAPLTPFVIPGAPRALDPYNIATTGASGFIGQDQSVAYRSVIVKTSTPGDDVEGEPSGRVAYTAPVGPRNLQVRMPLPSDALTGDRVRLYRTPTADVGTVPGDVMYLAAESVITSGEVTQGYKVVIDQTPDVLLGRDLYTNATREGILYGNRRPPLAADALVFGEGSGGGQLLLANISSPQSLTLRFIGVPDPGDQISIAGTIYQADIVTVTEPPTVSGGAVVYQTTNSLTVSENIRDTALSLVRVVNRYAGNTAIYARYASTENDPPGIIILEGRTLVLPPFLAVQVTPGVGLKFEPSIATAQTSYPDVRVNGIDVSKAGLHYAFPRAEGSARLRIGRSDRAILRIEALRNDVFAFKDGEGIFKLTPIADGWNVEQMSKDANLLIPESVAVLDNQILAYTTRGIVSVDAYGVEELDLPVKNYTEALAAFPPEVVQATTFAAADSTRLCYWLWFPETAGATVATRALLWNGRASPPAWTERTDAATGGYVSPDGFLMLGEALQPGFTASRRTGSVDDFQGPDGDAYTVRISWPNRAEGMPGASKHYRQARLYFEKPVGSKVTPLPVQWLFTNDYANTSPVRTNQVYGLPYSSMEPDPGYQRTSDLGIEVAFPVLRAYPVVKGVEEVVSSVSPVKMGRR